MNNPATKHNQHTTQIIVRLPIELHNKINSQVVNTKQTISQVVRESLKKTL
jgi:predicted DNA-binding protein